MARRAADRDAVAFRRARSGRRHRRSREAGEALTEVILETFRLNARLLEIAQERAAAGGLTAAWWQVLGGVIDEPRSVADVGRRMGVTRQAVQRIADLLVARGLAEYRPNPAHRRAKLLACTEAGYWAIRQISIVQRPWADEVGEDDRGRGAAADAGDDARARRGHRRRAPAPLQKRAPPADVRSGMNFDFADILLKVVEHKASDLHITSGAPPTIRVRGSLVPLEGSRT